MANLKNTSEKWNQWLAGIIDGDGYFYIDKKKTARFELTVGLSDEHVLQQIKNYYPGSLKLRAGAKAIRLRISQKQVLKDLLIAINGKIRYPKRLKQFELLCDHFELEMKDIELLTSDNAYLAGLFDSDGTICFNVSKTTAELSQLSGEFGKLKRLQESRGYHQLQMSITSKEQSFLMACCHAYQCGKVYPQKVNLNTKNPNLLYHWRFTLQDLPFLMEYWKKCPIRSVKRKRVFLLPHYLDLKTQKSYLAEGMQKKSWDQFCQKWYS